MVDFFLQNLNTVLLKHKYRNIAIKISLKKSFTEIYGNGSSKPVH